MVTRSRNRKTEKNEGDFDMLKFLNLDIYCNFILFKLVNLCDSFCFIAENP